MKKKKDLYLTPELNILVLTDLMESGTVPFSPNPDDPIAKEQKDIVIEEEETLPVNKNIWEDDEE